MGSKINFPRRVNLGYFGGRVLSLSCPYPLDGEVECKNSSPPV